MMIHRDAMGQPSAAANISLFGGNYGEPGTGRLVLTAASDAANLGLDWPYDSRDVSGIVSHMEAAGWSCTVDEDGYGAPYIRLVHRDTQTAIDEARAADEKRFAGAERGFIRFGGLPEGGRSRNHRDNTMEAGVSVFVAEFATDGGYRVIVDDVLKATYLQVMDRAAYRIYGGIVGTGADGEPVVKVSRSVKIRRTR